MSKKEFMKALRSKQNLYAYVVYAPNHGVHVKQSKSEWIKALKHSTCDNFDVIITDDSVIIN
jgi:ribosomal protein L25 (general stress protein Ctc)